MKRRLVTILSVMSLLLCVATSVLWVRSYWVSDTITLQHVHYTKIVSDDPYKKDWYHGQIAQDFIRTNRGSIGIFLRHSVDDKTVTLKDWSATYPEGTVIVWGRELASLYQPDYEFEIASESHAFFDHLGFFAGWCNIGGVSLNFAMFKENEFTVPMWFIAALAFILPNLRGVRCIRSGRRTKLGQCASCGYDLRATPGRCPECGTETKTLGHAGPGDKRTVYPSELSTSDTTGSEAWRVETDKAGKGIRRLPNTTAANRSPPFLSASQSPL